MQAKYKKTVHALMGLSFMGAFVFSPVLFTSSASAIDCGVLPQSICDQAGNKSQGGDIKNTGVWALLLLVVNIMTAGVAILTIGGIIYGAILYTSAGANQGQLAKAKSILQNVIIGVIAFAIMFSLLQWLIPGGVFN